MLYLKKTIIFTLISLLVLLVGCGSDQIVDVDAPVIEEPAASADVTETTDAAQETETIETTETTESESVETEVEEVLEVKSTGLQALSSEQPIEGMCEKVAVSWGGCKKVDNSETNLQISMLNAGKGELPGFYLYYKMKDGSWKYQEYRSTVIYNTTSTFPLDISHVEDVNKIYVYPEQEVEGVMTVCNVVPIGAFVPATNCKGVTHT